MQARASHDLSQGCLNQKQQVLLEASKAGAHSGVAQVEVGLTEIRRLTFETVQSKRPINPKKRHGINSGQHTQHSGA